MTFGLFALASVVFGCGQSAVYKDLQDCENGEWAIADVKRFEFEILDASKSYRINYLLRNAEQYPFYNIYLKSWLKDSTGKSMKSGMEELILFDEKTGKPLGDGLGDLFDHRFAASQYKVVRFPSAGKYSFEIQQNMRPDPLVGLLSVGIEVLDNTVPKEE